ncbi:hypothetical protein ACPA0F_18475 [Solibacillus silvestris]
MIWGVTKIPEWHYAEKWGYYQKTNGRVVCYIQRKLMTGYIMQLYKRGQMGICDIEYRSEDLNELLQLADEWLLQYQDGNLEEIHQHYYSPHNNAGYWVVEYPFRYQNK